MTAKGAFCFAILFAVLGALSALLPTYALELATRVGIFAIFAMSLDLLVGYTGLASLGHAAFFGLAGYCAGLTTLAVTREPGQILLMSLTATLVFSLLFSALALRTSGIYYLMLTLALAEIAWGIAFQWREITGGDDGLPGIPRPVLAGTPLTGTTSFYLFTAFCFATSAGFLMALVRSPFGLTLLGIRESPSRMAALGYNVWLHRYIASNIAALIAGLAGALYAWHNGIVTPNQMGLITSAEALIMVILGGAGTIVGPAVGAIVIVVLEFLVNRYTERWVSILGLIYIFVVVAAPQGLYALAGNIGRRAFRRDAL